jgi:hypothetical protein
MRPLGHTDEYKPFRWDLSKREQLPTLIPISDKLSKEWLAFEGELRISAAKVIAAAGDTDWVFVGRSPENLFDYLSGVFQGIPGAPSLTLLLFSLRANIEDVARDKPRAVSALGSYFTTERLDPNSIAAYGKAVTFIDVVDTGHTFRNLVRCLQLWSKQQRCDWNAVQRRIRFVGLTARQKTSPNAWRWQQHQNWLRELPDAKVKNISIPLWVLQWTADLLHKATPSHTVDRWAEIRGGRRIWSKERDLALKTACRLYDLGSTRPERIALAGRITRHQNMSDPWLRAIVLKLRRKTKLNKPLHGG